MGGAFAAKVIRQILLGDNIPSGRFRMDIVAQFQSTSIYQKTSEAKHA
jgi:hypothetical protein